ncbi:TonB-dependent receptor [Thiohalorhabdus sp.]|uniref:TonB-dependent receptor n=1 Tax=Thiohalorhabdus sp. TaxID=3094134 RepID=UPI002FC38B84
MGIDFQGTNRQALRYSDMMSNRVDYVQSLMWPDVTTAEAGAFVEMDHDLTKRDRLRVGLRYDRVDADAGRAEAASDLGSTPSELYDQYYGTEDDEASEDNVGGLVRYARDLTDRFTLHGTVSRSVRTADATERFIAADSTMKKDAWVGNPGIEPEKHHQAELGTTWNSDTAEVQASAYYNRVTDYLLTDKITDGSGNPATGYRNVDAALYGGELEADRTLGQHWRARATAAYVHGTKTTDDDPLPQMPPLEATAGLDYRAATWEAGAEVRMVDEQDRVDLESGQDVQETPGYAVVNLHGEVRLPARLKLRAGVDNLLDKTYSEHTNRNDSTTGEAILVNEPGGSVWMRLSGRF